MTHFLYEDSIFSPIQTLNNIDFKADEDSVNVLGNQHHSLTLLAVKDLQEYLLHQKDWKHNFGLSKEEVGEVIGKMFGVLVVRTQQDEIGYLSAFSGKLGGGNHHSKFVPPIYDGLSADGFLNAGMEKITEINNEIRELETQEGQRFMHRVLDLKNKRKAFSKDLQNRLFDQYIFVNKTLKPKSLIDIFFDTTGKRPPAGAGECAAPKLLQYAFINHMEPLAMTEFWWGASPKSSRWKHGHFYAPCQEKCSPLLEYMFSE